MKQDLELKLQAWLDGELPAAEAESMRRLIAEEPEAARLVAALQNVKTAFTHGEPGVVFPETRSFYWSKIQRQIRREEAVRRPDAHSWAGQLRRWLAPLAGVAALAAVLLVALNSSTPQALNQVSGTSSDMKARTFRDPSSGINFVVLQETPRPSAHTRNDGSSFMIENE